MRNVIYVLALFGCIAVVRAEDSLGTNTGKPMSFHAAIKQSWRPPELHVGTNAVILATNAVKLTSAPDIKQTQFGAYFEAFRNAVAERWVGLLEQHGYDAQKAGTVALEFQLHTDGRVTDIKVKESTVSQVLCLICQKSVLDLCPFARWPREMQKSIGAEQCALALAFKYPPGLTAVQAGALAQQLANEKAQSLYGIAPFSSRTPAESIGGSWAWHDLHGWGSGDIEGTVKFEADGAKPSVSVKRLDNGPLR